MFLFKNYAKTEAEELVPDLLLFFEKSSYEIKASDVQLRFNIFR